jgi:hypothetical protein
MKTEECLLNLEKKPERKITKQDTVKQAKGWTGVVQDVGFVNMVMNF